MNTIIPIILIIFSISIFYFYIDPTYQGNGEKDGIKQLLDERQKLNLQTSKVNQIIKKKSELEKKYNTIKGVNANAISDLIKMVPNNMENARLVNYIYNITTHSDIRGMSDLKITADVDTETKSKTGEIAISKQKNYNSVNLSFSFISDYKNFTKFIGDIYKSLRVVDVVSVSLKSENKEDALNYNKFKFNIIIRTYWLNNEL